MKPWERFEAPTEAKPWERYASKAETKERKAVDTPISGPLEALMSGASFGWSDEVAGAGRYVGRYLRNLTDDLMGNGPKLSDLVTGKKRKTPYEAYLEGKQGAKQNLENYSEDNPVTSTGLQVLGGLASASPSAGFQVAPTLGGRVRQGVQIGAPMGAVAGAGAAEGDAADVALGAGTGAVLGAGVGAALPAVSQGIATGVRHAANSFGARPADNVASEKMIGMLARDGRTPQSLMADIDARAAAGAKPEALMDMSGEATRRGVRTAMSRPGEGSSRGVQQLTERQAGQSERVGEDLARLSGVRDFHGTMEGLGRMRSQQAAPLYEEAFSNPAPVWNERIQQFIDSPEAQQGLRRGLMIQRREALANNQAFNPRSYGVTSFNEAGDPIITGTPNLRTLDAIKRGMDDMLEQYRDRTSGRLVLDEAGRALQAVRRSYVDEVDRAAPEVYRQARQAWSGPSQSRDALEAGRTLFMRDPEQTTRRLQAMSPGDRDFFRAGAAKAIRDKIESTPDGGDVVRRIFGTPKMRAQIETVFPSRQEFEAFRGAMEREAAMLRNARFVSPNTNSQTFLRQMDAADADPNPIMEGISNMMQGQSPARAMLGTLTGRAASRLGGYTPEVSDRVIQNLMSADPAVQRQVLTGLMTYQPNNPALSAIGARARQGLLTSGAGLYGARE